MYHFPVRTSLVVPYFPKTETQVPMLACKALYDLAHAVVPSIVSYQNYASPPSRHIVSTTWLPEPKSEPL